MNIKVTADSTCDLSPDLIRELDVEIIPLYVMEDGLSHRDGVGYSPEDIFRHFDQTGRLCKTAAVNTADYAEIFSRLSAEYDAVIHLTQGFLRKANLRRVSRSLRRGRDA